MTGLKRLRCHGERIAQESVTEEVVEYLTNGGEIGRGKEEKVIEMMETCAICDFSIDGGEKYEKGIFYSGKWICYTCIDELQHLKVKQEVIKNEGN